MVVKIKGFCFVTTSNCSVGHTSMASLVYVVLLEWSSSRAYSKLRYWDILFLVCVFPSAT